MINVAGNLYEEEYLLNLINKDTLNFENNDVLYCILLNSNFNIINKIITYNKIAKIITDTDKFWYDKLLKDYNDVKVESTNYKLEYEKIYYAYMNAEIMTKVLLVDNKTHYLCVDNISINIINYDFYWLSTDILKNVYHKTQVLLKCEGFNIEFQNNEDDTFVTFETLSLSKRDYIKFMTKIFYHYPNIMIEDCDDYPYVYTINNVMDNYSVLNNITYSELDIVDYRMKLWGDFLCNK